MHNPITVCVSLIIVSPLSATHSSSSKSYVSQTCRIFIFKPFSCTTAQTVPIPKICADIGFILNARLLMVSIALIKVGEICVQFANGFLRDKSLLRKFHRWDAKDERFYIRFILQSFNFVSVSVPAANILPTNNSTGETLSTTFRHDDTESTTTSSVIFDHRPNHLHLPAPAKGSRRNSNDLKLCLRKENLNESDSPNRGRTQTFFSRNSKDRLKAMAEFDRRGSLESSEFRRLRNLKEPDRRSSSGLKHLSSLNKSADNLVSENHSIERPISTTSIGLKSPRQRKISNIFRKISVNSRSSSKTNLAKIKGKPYLKTTEEDLIRERDHAIDEWSRSATKCEELVDEVDMMLSHLANVRVLNYLLVAAN